jgi:MFS family permease
MMTATGAVIMNRARRWAIGATMLSGTMLAILDSSILTILVVPIMETFNTDLRTVEWVLTSYNLAFVVFLIGLGSLGDSAGRRRLHVWGQTVFALDSGLAVIARGPWQLMAFRALQGLGAAALAPTALALMLDHFSEGERRAALGVWGAAAGLGGGWEPTLGEWWHRHGDGAHRVLTVSGLLALAASVAIPLQWSPKALTSLTPLENHALQQGMPPPDLEGIHQALVRAVQLSFEQASGLAAVLAGSRVVVALRLPRRIATQASGGLPSAKAMDGSSGGPK